MFVLHLCNGRGLRNPRRTRPDPPARSAALRTRALTTLTHISQFAELAEEQGVPGFTLTPYTSLFADELTSYLTTSRGPVKRR